MTVAEAMDMFTVPTTTGTYEVWDIQGNQVRHVGGTEFKRMDAAQMAVAFARKLERDR